MHAARTAFVATLFVYGCSPQLVPTTPRYPTAARTAERELSFMPASGVTRLVLPCAEVENEIDNGLDDNCDGRLDQQAEPITANLFVALAHNTQVDLELAMTAGSDPAAEASLTKSVISRVQVCQSAAPFTIQQAAFPQLAPGRYEIAIVHGKACGAELPATANASLWLEGKAKGVYAVNVAPGGRIVLGTVEVR